jgi:hypothetical protein
MYSEGVDSVLIYPLVLLIPNVRRTARSFQDNFLEKLVRSELAESFLRILSQKTHILRETVLNSTRCCILFAETSMNKLYRLPLRMRSKTQLSDVRRRRKLPNLVVAGILVVGALFALTAIGLTVFGAFKHKANVPKEVGVPPDPPSADASPTASQSKENDVVMPLANPNPTPSTPVASSHSTNDQQSSAPESKATPARSSTPAGTSASVGQKHEQKADVEAKNPDKSLIKAGRQSLEKKRKDAERRRARLEEKYQNHEISTDAYNKGEEEYKSEIQKYRHESKSDK